MSSPANTQTETAIVQFGPDAERFWRYWKSLPLIDGIPSLADFFDHSPSDLQPSLSVVDFRSADDMRVRLLGTKLVEVIGELTNSSANDLYQEGVRTQATGMGWLAVSQPCGYIAERTLRTNSGRSFISRGLSLPIRTKHKSLITLNTMEKSESWNPGLESGFKVTGVAHRQWIDIGFGTPSGALPPQQTA